MNSNKRAPKSLPTCGTIRGAQGLQVQLKNGLAGTKRYADLSAGDAPIAYQSSHPFHSPRVGASRCQTKKKKAGAALDPTHHQRGCHPARRSNPSAPRQGIKTASASRKIGRESSTLRTVRHIKVPEYARARFVTQWLRPLAGRSWQYDAAIGTGAAVNNSGAAAPLAYSVIAHGGA